MTKRSGSNTRRRAISRPVRLTAEEDQEIRKRAAECGKTVSGFYGRQLSVRKLTH